MYSEHSADDDQLLLFILLWSSGKGKGIGSTQEVTQSSFIDYRLSIIDNDFPDALH